MSDGHPHEGGSYVLDPATGERKRVAFTAPHPDPVAPGAKPAQAAAARKPAPTKAAPEKAAPEKAAPVKSDTPAADAPKEATPQ